MAVVLNLNGCLIILMLWSSQMSVNSIEITINPDMADYNYGNWRRSSAKLQSNKYWTVTFDCEKPTTNSELTWHVDGLLLPNVDYIRVTSASNANGSAVSRMTFNNFSYPLINQYGCLRISKASHSYISFTPTVVPIIEGLVSVVGDSATVSMTCKAPLYTPLYWIIPETNSEVIVTNSTDRSVSSVSTITFKTQQSNSYLGYQCCAEIKDKTAVGSQQCTTHGFINGVPSVTEYNMNCNDPIKGCILKCIFKGVLKSNETQSKSSWLVCNTSGTQVCQTVNSTSQTFIQNYMLMTTLEGNFTANFSTATCKASNFFGEGQHKFDLVPNKMGPMLKSSSATFDRVNGNIIYKCTIYGNPRPKDVTWTKINRNSEMLHLSAYTSSNSSEYTITTEPSTSESYQITSTLKIGLWRTNTQVSTFSCQSDNDYGSVTSSPMMPESNLDVNISYSSLTPQHGEGVEVICYARDNLLPEAVIEVASPLSLRHYSPLGKGYLYFIADMKNTPVYARCYYNDFTKTESLIKEIVISASTTINRSVTSLFVVVGSALLIISTRLF